MTQKSKTMGRQEIIDLINSKMVIDPKELAQILGMSENPIYNALRDGEIPSIKIGGSWKISTAYLARLLHIENQNGKPSN